MSFLRSRALLESACARVIATLRFWFCVLACSLAAGCAAPVTPRVAVDEPARIAEEQAQQALALQSEFAMTLRLWSVGYAVVKASTADCTDTLRPSLGIYTLSTEQLPARESRDEALQRMLSGVPVKLKLQRAGQYLVVDVVPDMVCDYPLQNTMGHRGKKTANATVGLLFDVVGAAAGVNARGAFSDVGARAFSQDFEREADHVGMFYLAQAGYPTEGAAQFWRRMATEHPASIRTNLSATHPATAESFIALERIAADIRDKQGRREPLIPARAKP
jgi:hypothetical protein